jgi:hypothetical protein
LEGAVKVKYRIGIILVYMLIPSCLAFGQKVRLPEGTSVHVRLKADLASELVEEGARVDFEAARPVVIQGITVIPEGAVAWGAVQGVKKGKSIKFDIEGVQLPDGTNVKLRTSKEKTKNSPIKADSDFKRGIGAPKGNEYTAYIDEDQEVAVSGQGSNPALAATPSAAPTVPPTQAAAPPPAPAQAVAPSASTETPAVTSSTPPAQPAVTTPAVATPAPSATSPANVERVTVECYSDPSWADIFIDGEFYGNTPSILKIPVGRHDLQIQFTGYKTWTIPLILQSGAGTRRIRASLEQKE